MPQQVSGADANDLAKRRFEEQGNSNSCRLGSVVVARNHTSRSKAASTWHIANVLSCELLLTLYGSITLDRLYRLRVVIEIWCSAMRVEDQVALTPNPTSRSHPRCPVLDICGYGAKIVCSIDEHLVPVPLQTPLLLLVDLDLLIDAD